MSGAVEIIGAVSAFSTLLQLANKIRETFDKIPQNRAIYHETTKDLVETLEFFEAFHTAQRDRIDSTELSQSLSQFSTVLRKVHKKSAKAFKPRKGIAVVKTIYIQWTRAGEIKDSILRVDKEIQRCYQRFLLSSIARIQDNQVSTSAQMIHVLRQIQESIGSLGNVMQLVSPLPQALSPPSPVRPTIREGMVVFARVSLKMAHQSVKRMRPLSPTNEGRTFNEIIQAYPIASKAREFVGAISRIHNRHTSTRPCVVLFVDKPEAGRVIVAPITSREGHLVDDKAGEILDEQGRCWYFPIPSTPTHRLMSPTTGQGEIDQEFADVPNWASRADGHMVDTAPQYLVLGLPITYQSKQLRLNEGYQRFHLDSSRTKWCQQKSLSFMSDWEIEHCDLTLQALEHRPGSQ